MEEPERRELSMDRGEASSRGSPASVCAHTNAHQRTPVVTTALSMRDHDTLTRCQRDQLGVGEVAAP
eukprot:3815397-Rhodomonas_salina.1